eukprot:scaffold8069_cov126-Isochrysis_galbana.AAC.12
MFALRTYYSFLPLPASPHSLPPPASASVVVLSCHSSTAAHETRDTRAHGTRATPRTPAPVTPSGVLNALAYRASGKVISNAGKLSLRGAQNR